MELLMSCLTEKLTKIQEQLFYCSQCVRNLTVLSKQTCYESSFTGIWFSTHIIRNTPFNSSKGNEIDGCKSNTVIFMKIIERCRRYPKVEVRLMERFQYEEHQYFVQNLFIGSDFNLIDSILIEIIRVKMMQSNS